MCAWLRRHPLAGFVILAYGLTWALLPLAHRYTPVGVLALLCPAVAAAVTASACGGHEAGELLARVTRWRVAPRWYLLAMILPLPTSFLASLLEGAWGAPGPVSLAALSWLGAVVFVMVLGEETGWRGFALPRLQATLGPLGASIALGVIWAVWHLPLFFMSSMPQFGSPFVAYVPYTIALSIILTFLSSRTAGSVVIATLFHGSVNTFVLVNEGANAAQRGWGNALAYGIAALFIVVMGGLRSPAGGMGKNDAAEA